jgi:murein DD-endopeptidase MepM/ murein hydrolase activator NlpD
MNHGKTILLTIPLCVACAAAITAACAPASPPAPTKTIDTPAASSPSPQPQTTNAPSLPTPAPQEPTPSIVPFQVCSPLADIAPVDLTSHISNLYNPPKPGSDAPHQGIDLADYYGENRIAVEGHAVNVVLDGRVAAVISERFPYGSAILIETPLENLPPDWLSALQLPPHIPEINTNTALTCPPMPDQTIGLQETTSLYLLYAHLQSSPVLQVGELVQCGQTIGAVGSSGNALNPHLHLEARTGPGGANLGSMAHYDPSASEDEMRTYCTWRVSGLFILFDPMALFAHN